MRTSVLLIVAGTAAAACGPAEVRETPEERPLDQAAALDAVQEALTARHVQSERFRQIVLPNGREWTVDVAGTDVPVAIEYLTEQDRQRVGDGVPIQSSPGDIPHIIVVHRAGSAGAEEDLYLRVFTDQHFRFQPNPPPDMEGTPYTIREVTARLKRDVADFVAWHASTHGAPGATP